MQLKLFITPIIPIFQIKMINSFKISAFEPTIGKWDLLYSTNQNFNINGCNLQISPCKNKFNELCVKIKRYERNNLITYIKTINCNIYSNSSNEIDGLEKCLNPMKNQEICTLVLLKTEKLIKSIGVFEFPYFAVNYLSGMNPKYIIKWKVDKDLGRLYISFDKNTYIFEKECNNINDKRESITTNFFLITNLLSFLLGKLLEKTIHIN